MAETALLLSGDDPRILKKIAQIKARAEVKRTKLVRLAAKQEKQQREKRLNEKPVTIFTVNHKPTYCITSYKRIDPKPQNNSANFRTTPTFVSKSEIQSLKSQSRLKNAVHWMLLFADKKRLYSKEGIKNKKTGQIQHNFSFRLAFLTLTLPTKQKHSDEYIKAHMLQPFLYWLNRYYSALYVWKAESQLNGNIHFHITIDTFIHWKSVRAKWNKLLAKHDYCKVYQDGTNDKGNSATQIKAVLKESSCARDIGGYMSKKDRVAEKDREAIEKLKKGYEDSNVHCKYNSALRADKQDQQWYKRVIDGRLWGCSENLSGINIFLDETFAEFQKEEKIFFRANDDIQNLGKKVTEREKEKYRKVDIAERTVRGLTDEDIDYRYRFMQNVFIHKNLMSMKKGATLQALIHEQKLLAQKNTQKFFTVNSLN